jgi:hypothetical protein
MAPATSFVAAARFHAAVQSMFRAPYSATHAEESYSPAEHGVANSEVLPSANPRVASKLSSFSPKIIRGEFLVTIHLPRHSGSTLDGLLSRVGQLPALLARRPGRAQEVAERDPPGGGSNIAEVRTSMPDRAACTRKVAHGRQKFQHDFLDLERRPGSGLLICGGPHPKL